MKAPKKIYLCSSDRAGKDYDDEWYYNPWGEDYVEYTHTDVFIEKVISWLKEQEEMVGVSFQEDFLERFKNYMNGTGYEWNAEKKELKKIDSYCQEHCKGYRETGRCFVDGECQAKKNAESDWSKKDEDALSDALWCCKQAIKTAKDDNDMSTFGMLKNGSNQLRKDFDPQWKPSEEEIQALEYQVNSTYKDSWQYKASKELLEQLKKL